MTPTGKSPSICPGIRFPFKEKSVKNFVKKFSDKGLQVVTLISKLLCEVVSNGFINDLLPKTEINPLFDDKNYILMFNGEIYNHAELRSQLIKKGYKKFMRLISG